jgi:acyl-ACP thioesterase
MPISPVYSKSFLIPQTVIDENGHVNNVAYVQWMHAESVSLLNIMNQSVGWILCGQLGDCG